MKKIEIRLHRDLAEQMEENKLIAAIKLGMDEISDEQYVDIAMTLMDTFLNPSNGEVIGVWDLKSGDCKKMQLPKLPTNIL